MSLDTQNKLSIAREFTNTEDLALEVWLNLKVAGNDALAQSLLDAGLMVEHFTSRLDDDASKRTPDQFAQLHALENSFQFQLNEATQFFQSKGIKNSAARAIQLRLTPYQGDEAALSGE